MFSNASSIATNVVMFIVFVGLVTAGVLKGLKDFREYRKSGVAAADPAGHVAAATLLENVTLHDWTQSNRAVVVALERLCDTLAKHLDETADLRRVMEDVRHDIRAPKG